jgi:putative Holliday junction resolvase
MRILGLDVGDMRTGVAISDPQGILATPLSVLASRDEDAVIEEILGLVEQHRVECVIVGLPRRLSGDLGKQARKVTTFADKLSLQAEKRNLDQLDVRLWDERLSTKAAERLKTEGRGRRSNLHFKERKGGRSRSLGIKAEVDAIAAAFILQGFLDSQTSGDNEES